MPSANNSLIDCFYRIIAVNRRVNPRIGAREGFPSAGLGIFLDKRVGFAGRGQASALWRWLPLGGFTPTATPGGALLECGMGWAWNGGNAGVGNLTVGFVPGADVQLLIFWHVCALLELVGFSAHCWHFANCS